MAGGAEPSGPQAAASPGWGLSAAGRAAPAGLSPRPLGATALSQAAALHASPGRVPAGDLGRPRWPSHRHPGKDG